MTVFDLAERRGWAGKAGVFAGSFGKLCGYAVGPLLDAAGVGGGVRVLDVGTGGGAAARAAWARGAGVVAVDAESSMVERASRAVPEADVRLGTLPELPFEDGEFDAVVANFVVNHVGQPRRALAELRRVARPGGRVAVTIWTAPPAAGQALLGRAVQAAGATRPDHLPALDPADDFPRTEQGFAGLLTEAGLTNVTCRTLAWDHRTTPEEWWGGAIGGVGTIGQIISSQSPELISAIAEQFAVLSKEFAAPDGTLALPHTALLAHGLA